MTNLIGQSLGRYQILEQLGEGGMATVYKAYDTRLETDVAVKVIRTEALPQNMIERALKRFEREAKSLARLTHPNIVKVTDYGEYQGKPYLVMEYLPGGTLKERIQQGPLPWQEAVRLLLPISQALAYAHQQNLIHRDVKPSNILLTGSGQPMLTDFGVAKLFDLEETADLTGTGMGVGTPEYMAPEQWQGQVGPQTDVYALGVVLYEMLTGRKPYQADTPAALLLKQANEPLPRPRNFAPGLPDAVEKVLLKALAKKPGDRYPGPAEFASALENLLGQAGKPRASVIPSIPALNPSKRENAPSGSKHPRSRGWMAAGLGALVVIVAFLIFILPQVSWPDFGQRTVTATSLVAKNTAATIETPAVTLTIVPTTMPAASRTLTPTLPYTPTYTPSTTPTASQTSTPKLETCTWTEVRPSYGIFTWICSCGETICFCRVGSRRGPNDATTDWTTYNRTFSIGEIKGNVSQYNGSCY